MLPLVLLLFFLRARADELGYRDDVTGRDILKAQRKLRNIVGRSVDLGISILNDEKSIKYLVRKACYHANAAWCCIEVAQIGW